MTAICPAGFQIINGICYDNCPSFTEVYVDDYTICIQNDACPFGTTTDSTGLQCNKVAPNGVVSKTDATCAVGFTEWTLGLCYINCPNDWMENGLSCSRNVFVRNTATPLCPALYSLQGDNCVFDWSEVFLIAIIAILIAYTFMQGSSTYKSPPEIVMNDTFSGTVV